MLHRRSATKKVEFGRTTKERAPLPGGAHSEAGMTAKEFLRGIRRLDAIINCKQAQLDELRTRAESVTVPLKPDKIQSGNAGSQEDILVRIVDLEWEINAEIDRLVAEKDKAIKLICTLEDDRHITLLRRHYVDGATWEQIAVDMGYSWRHIHRIHAIALIELQKKMS